MSASFVASYWILWAIVIVLAVLVLALARQVGILHERVAPAGALMPTKGIKPGELTVAMTATTLSGGALSIGGTATDGFALLILFVSPTCPVCKSLVPTAQSLANHERRRLRLLFASDGDTLEKHRTYARDMGIDENSYVVSQELGMTYSVSRLPFAVLIGATGQLESKGLVNSREHLESLVESMDSGVTSLQEYMQKREARETGAAGEKAS